LPQITQTGFIETDIYTIKDLNFLPRPFEAIFPFEAPRLLFFASCTSLSDLVPCPCPPFLYGERVGRRLEGLCRFVWRQPLAVHSVRHDDSRCLRLLLLLCRIVMSWHVSSTDLRRSANLPRIVSVALFVSATVCLCDGCWCSDCFLFKKQVAPPLSRGQHSLPRSCVPAVAAAALFFSFTIACPIFVFCPSEPFRIDALDFMPWSHPSRHDAVLAFFS
jgi:hypothetical protein